MRPFRFPAYPQKPHQASGQARVKIKGRHYYLGKHGSPESRKKYAALASQFASHGIPPAPSKGSSIEELAAAFLCAHSHLSTLDQYHFARVLKALTRRYGSASASAFSAVDLGRLRDDLITGDWLTTEERKHPKAGGWARGQVNRAIARVKSVFRWGESKGYVEPGRWHHLGTLSPLGRKDRVRQTKPREGVEWPTVQAVLSHLPGPVAAMVETQWWAGMRPAEVVSMTVEAIEDKGDVWFYWLTNHKNDWREGRSREAVVLGPEAIRVLRPWVEAARARGGAVFLSWKTGKPYTTGGYGQALATAFDRHPELTRFTAYQCRHGAKRRITRELGLDAARAALRQSHIATTDRYDSGQDLDLAIRAARKTG